MSVLLPTSFFDVCLRRLLRGWGCAGLTVFLTALNAKAANPPETTYVPFGHRSPGAKYDVAWGIAGKKINPTHLPPDSEKFLDDIFSSEKNVIVNAVVERRTGRVIWRIRNSHYFPRENHGSASSSFWSPNENFMVYFWDGKWEPRGLFLLHIGGKSGSGQTNLLPSLRRDLMAFWEKRDHSTFQKDHFRAVVEVGDIIVKNNSLSAVASTDYPDKRGGEDFTVRIDYTLHTNKNGPFIVMRAIKEMPSD